MNLVTLDFETYYGGDYTLSKMTTEAYVRDPGFETILCSFKVNDGPSFWIDKPRLHEYLHSSGINLHECAVVMHHAHFDALILNHHYNIRPKVIIDTLGMARAVHGAGARLSLAKLGEKHGIGAKGDEVLHVKDMRFADFTYHALQRYGKYCCNDVELTYALAKILMPHFSRAELKINDAVVRMFTEPKLQLNVPLLQAYAEQLALDKATQMLQAGVQREDLMSNEKFAELLRERGIEPPMKRSLATGKDTYAFAKTDPVMQEMLDYPDESVQFLVAARIGAKSTLAETRAKRMIDMQGRGPTAIYLKYSGASGTHRLSGGDSMNWQNMGRGSRLRDALEAPDGSVIVVGDSSNIEPRLLDHISGQDDMVDVYRKADRKEGPDMYCVIAERIYKHPVQKSTHPMERQMGKVAKLMLGYGSGAENFQIIVRAQAKDANGKPLKISTNFSEEVVNAYREAHPKVRQYWKRMEGALKAIVSGHVGVDVDYRGSIKTCKDGLQMPCGIKILLPDLKYGKERPEDAQAVYTFWNGKAREKIYGAKLTGITTQCLARILVLHQCLNASEELKREGVNAPWVHSVHDEGLLLATVFEAPYTLGVLMKHMRIAPDWMPDIPLNSEGGFHKSYGKAKA